jgi:hypothetical protein
MITGWLSPEDCPDCGGPLLDTSVSDRLLVLACPGCGYAATWHATDPGSAQSGTDDPTDPGETETA